MLVETPSTLNPWVEIWFRPRTTIRQIVETNPRYLFYTLAVLTGVASGTSWITNRLLNYGLEGRIVLPLSFLVLILWAPLEVTLIGISYRFIGRALGGVATTNELCAAFVWSALPRIAGILLWIPSFFLFGTKDYLSAIASLNSTGDPALVFVSLSFTGMNLILVLWQCTLLVLTVTEVHKFSIWRGLLTAILPSVILISLSFLFRSITG